MTDPNVPSNPPPYGAAPAAPYAPYAAAAPASAPTNVLAIVALIAAFVIPLAGIICGHIAMKQIARTGEGGHQLALWGTILGYVFTGISLIFIVLYFVVIAVAVGGAATSGYMG